MNANELNTYKIYFSTEAEEPVLIKTEHGKQSVSGVSYVTFLAASLIGIDLVLANTSFNPSDPWTVLKGSCPIPFMFGKIDRSTGKRISAPIYRLYDELNKNGARGIDWFEALTGQGGAGGGALIGRYLAFGRNRGRMRLAWVPHNQMLISIYSDNTRIRSIQDLFQIKKHTISRIKNWPLVATI